MVITQPAMTPTSASHATLRAHARRRAFLGPRLGPGARQPDTLTINQLKCSNYSAISSSLSQIWKTMENIYMSSLSQINVSKLHAKIMNVHIDKHNLT